MDINRVRHSKRLPMIQTLNNKTENQCGRMWSDAVISQTGSEATIRTWLFRIFTHTHTRKAKVPQSTYIVWV